MDFLKDLNKEQLEAVLETTGSLLVLAGAGSGKTRVITYRIAHLIKNKGVLPSSIMAVTFTNKAAKEMQERVKNLIGFLPQSLWIGTFHALSGRLLRSEISKVDPKFNKHFIIVDEEDRLKIIKTVLKELGYDPKYHSPEKIVYGISGLKDQLTSPEEYQEEAYGFEGKVLASVYGAYQEKLRANNALDFDDLIFFAVRALLKEEIKAYYSDKFKYILVDEYQDINYSQYMFLKLLASKHKNISVVGDDDQAIYSFRGSSSKFILKFEDDYPDCKIIKLEQNYRSTEPILEAANSLVLKNRTRHIKRLWTSIKEGERPILYEAMNPQDEANFIGSQIEKLARKGKSYKNFAILYRANFQSRPFEDYFMSKGTPYQVIGGFKFYQREEIKDIICYLRLYLNKNDNISFERIINKPARGFGDKSLSILKETAKDNNLNYFDALSLILDKPNEKTQTAIKKFIDALTVKEEDKDKSLRTQTIDILENTNYLEALREKNDLDSLNRIENIEEFLRIEEEFTKTSVDKSLENFLQTISLFTDSDSLNENLEKVTLLTVHQAKGLEWPVVFIVGLEEGLFPHRRSMETTKDLEEERRLFYVAITRAKERLFLSYSQIKQSFSYMQTGFMEKSRFLDEIEKGLIVNAKEIEEEEEVLELKMGDKVFHKIFGKGTVVEVYQEGKEKICLIDFIKAGVKKISLKYKVLEKLD